MMMKKNTAATTTTYTHIAGKKGKGKAEEGKNRRLASSRDTNQ
jgi:hypothetical protein